MAMSRSGHTTKEEIVALMRAELGIQRRDAARVVDAMFDLIARSLADGREVRVTGFGRFQAVPRNEGKVQRNPKTGERVPVVPGNRVRFMAYDQLRDVVNGGDNGGRPVTRRHSHGTSGDVPS